MNARACSTVHERLNEIGNWGLGDYPTPAIDSPDVAYVKVLRDVTETRTQVGDEIILVPAVLTLV